METKLKENNFKNTNPLIESEQLSFNEKSRTITHYISSETVNRYGYRLKNDGLDENNYRKNPIVLYNHTLTGFCDNPPPKELIIGKNNSLSIDSKGILAETYFADTPLGSDIMEMNKNGLMKSWSVGWDSNEDFQNLDGIPTMLKWDLLEYSSVIIPANPDAVNQMLSFTKTNSLRKILSLDFAILNYKNEFDNELSTLKSEIQKLVTPDNAHSEKSISDLRNELKSLVKNNEKNTTELFMKVAGKLSNIETNLHKSVLSKMENIIEGTIRKYLGKVD